ncbi:recombinase family protein [Paenisporosarcina sp. NPDC076898]|uniref:recombinase family protein n=1 Tax=unclassified Paenisporosarcina TaxID=2642018 RepID=UPI003D03EF2E
MYRISSSVNAYERMIIGKRIKNNKLQMARQGLNASGSVPLGYKRNPVSKKLEIDEETADTVRYAFKLCNDGYGASKIAQALNDAGYTTAKGNAYSTRAVKEMLKVQTYKGFTVYNNVENLKVKDKETGEIKTVRKAKETIVVEGTHPAIIAPEVFDSVQEKRANRAEVYAGSREKLTSKTEPSILKDLIYCGVCGRKVRISYEAKKQCYLIRSCTDLMQDGSKCVNSGFLAVYVERDIILKVLERKLQVEEEIQLLLQDNVEQLQEEHISMQKQLQKQLLQLDSEMKGLMKMELKYEMQGIENATQEEFFREEKQNNINTKERVQKQLENLLIKMKQPSVQDEIKKRVHVVKLIEELDGKSSEQINLMLKQFIKKIQYKRIIPEEIQKLGAKNPLRKDYGAELEIEYFV